MLSLEAPMLYAGRMLAQHFARSGASHVHGHIAAADDQHFLPDGELVAEIDVEQKIDALVHAIEVHAGNGEVAAAMCADRQQHRIEALRRRSAIVKSRPAA